MKRGNFISFSHCGYFTLFNATLNKLVIVTRTSVVYSYTRTSVTARFRFIGNKITGNGLPFRYACSQLFIPEVRWIVIDGIFEWFYSVSQSLKVEETRVCAKCVLSLSCRQLLQEFENVFWVLAPCVLVEDYRRFIYVYCLISLMIERQQASLKCM